MARPRHARRRHAAPRGRLDGPVGWVAATAGCLLHAWCFGVFYAFATALEQVGDEFDAELSSLGLVFGLTTFWFFAFGLMTGPLADRFGARPLILVGAVFMGGGLYLTAQAESLILVYLTYGIGVGTGIGLYLVPITVAVGGWFDRKRASGLGLTTAGIGLGTLALVPVAEWVIRTRGWREAFELMGIGSVAVFVLAGLAIARPPTAGAPATTRRPMQEVLTERSFWRMYFAGLLMSTALFAPFVYLVDYATERGVSSSAAAALISVLGVGSVLGRLGIGPIAARTGVMPLIVIAFAVQPFAYFLWLMDGDAYPSMVSFAAVLGVGYGGYVALSPVAAAELFGVEGLGRVLGVLYTSAGLGALVGPWAMGLVIERAGYDTMILLSIGIAGLATSIAIPLWTGEPRPLIRRRARPRKPKGTNEPLVFLAQPSQMERSLDLALSARPDAARSGPVASPAPAPTPGSPSVGEPLQAPASSASNGRPHASAAAPSAMASIRRRFDDQSAESLTPAGS